MLNWDKYFMGNVKHDLRVDAEYNQGSNDLI